MSPERSRSAFAALILAAGLAGAGWLVGGGIGCAQQGYFSIEDRDPVSPEWKKIRDATIIDDLLD